ncbi:MAG: hypothetical protein CMD18_03055 [Flavobacteriales bacterium]|nr:hypothetical protein [Flavobacteriales bacterium]
MFMLFRYLTVRLSCTLISGVFFLSSCADENIIYSNYIPSDASVVISINTESIFNAAAFDLLGNNNLFNNLSFGPISNIIQNPSSAGLKMFSTYHLFFVGSNLLQPKIGAILPLNDGEDLTDYIEDNFESKIVKKEGFQMADISENKYLIWDEHTAIYYSGYPDTNLINESKILCSQKDKNTLEKIDTSFSFALNSNSHISVWVKNNAINKLAGQGLLLLEDFNLINRPLNKRDTSLKGKTVFLTNFNKGNISIKQRKFINSDKYQEKNNLIKENNLASIVAKTVPENPTLLINTFVNFKDLIEIFNLLNLDKDWHKQRSNLPFLPDLNQLGDYFQGDVMVHIDGVQEITKAKQIPDIDEEGNDILVTKDVIEKKIDLSLGLLVKDSLRFNFLVNLLGSNLPKTDGFFNYNDEVYFCTKENNFFITTTRKGVKYLNEMNGELSPNLDSIVANYKSVFYVDLADMLKQFEILTPQSLGGIDNLKNILFFEKASKKEGIIEGEIIIKFKNEDNSFVSILRLISGLVSTFNPSSSIGIE